VTYSSLIDLKLPPTARKWSSRGGRRPNGMIVHHWASTSMAGRDRLVYSSDPASANYLIYNDGRLVGSVPEEYRAWTSSSFAADDDKITVEIQNETGAPGWKISAAAFATLVRLYADVARRNGFAATRGNLFGHRDFYATACPGPYLYPRLGEVATQAAALNRGGGASRDDDRKPVTGKTRKPHRIATIRKGDRSWRSELLQQALAERGHKVGKVDGVFGNQTEDATREFQRDADLVDDGVVGSKTWFRLCWGARRGQGNTARVRIAKRVAGYTGLSVLGGFGPKTETRWKEIQRWLGVDPDGVIKTQTTDALIKKG
jgi:N-acetyl-anhydromuramyl-L-alanine amidase AmpD